MPVASDVRIVEPSEDSGRGGLRVSAGGGSRREGGTNASSRETRPHGAARQGAGQTSSRQRANKVTWSALPPPSATASIIWVPSDNGELGPHPLDLRPRRGQADLRAEGACRRP